MSVVRWWLEVTRKERAPCNLCVRGEFHQTDSHSVLTRPSKARLLHTRATSGVQIMSRCTSGGSVPLFWLFIRRRLRGSDAALANMRRAFAQVQRYYVMWRDAANGTVSVTS